MIGRAKARVGVRCCERNLVVTLSGCSTWIRCHQQSPLGAGQVLGYASACIITERQRGRDGRPRGN